jgi:hypothetical protein
MKDTGLDVVIVLKTKSRTNLGCIFISCMISKLRNFFEAVIGVGV